MLQISGGNNYEFKRGLLIKHVGIPIYANRLLVTPFKVVWWWPLNWLICPFIFLKCFLTPTQESKDDPKDMENE